MASEEGEELLMRILQCPSLLAINAPNPSSMARSRGTRAVIIAERLLNLPFQSVLVSNHEASLMKIQRGAYQKQCDPPPLGTPFACRCWIVRISILSY